MNKKFITSFILLALMAATAACGGTSDEAMFKVSGLADVSYSAQSLGSIDKMEVEYTEKDGSVATYSGFPLSEVIALAGVTEFSAVNMLADDGYSAEVTVDELTSCADCIIAIVDDGSWRTVMPGFSGKLQVKNLIELNIQ